jgi:hypothetical protein
MRSMMIPHKRRGGFELIKQLSYSLRSDFQEIQVGISHRPFKKLCLLEQ